MRAVVVFLALWCLSGAAFAQTGRDYFGFRFGMTEAEARAVPGERWYDGGEEAREGEIRVLLGMSPRLIGGVRYLPMLSFESGRLTRIALMTGGLSGQDECGSALQDVVVNFEREFGVFNGAPSPEEQIGAPTMASTQRGSQLRFYTHAELGQLGFANVRGEAFVRAHSTHRSTPREGEPEGPSCTVEIAVEQRMPADLVTLAPPPAPEALALAPRLARSDWAARPDGADFARHYPPWALEAGRGGAVNLDCLVQADGSLQCAVAEENPADMGFGAAARAIAQAFRMREMIDGEPSAGKRVRVPIRFSVAE